MVPDGDTAVPELLKSFLLQEVMTSIAKKA